jgi:hypothetical protein
MCLDPRPDSIARVRPSATRKQPAPRPVASTEARVTRSEPREGWIASLADSLDARGWTLVTRSVTSC